MDPQIRPWSQGMQDVNQAQLGQQAAQTGLIKLAQLKQSQASEAEVMAAIQRDPSLQALLFGGGMPQSTLGSLQSAHGGPPGPGPSTQSPLGGGPAQQIPAYPDASRYAQVSPQGGGPIPPSVAQQLTPQVTPPQGTIASLGPQPQGQMQAPQNPLLEMARRDPRAALMLQQQMQAQQDRQWKLQEQQLDMGVKVAGFVARELQGVTDQASLDQARERVRQVHPQAAAQMPQMYSKEGIETVQQRGIAISDMALWKLNMAKARKATVEAEMLPKLLEQEGGGGTTPAGGTAPTTATTTGTPARSAPPEFESAITDANRLYPQVSTPRIKSIIAAESNFDPKAVSSAGAQGPMQLMPDTAKEMGVDDPFNVQQNVRGGTRYYAQMLTKYGGDERKALTAYNWGPGNLDKVGGDVTQAPAATQAYVNRVLGDGGTGGGGGGPTGSAQAPPEDPRVSGLRAQIKQGQAKAKQYALLGYESMATQYSKDVDDLQKEVDRLEAPRRAYETKLATAGIEKDIAGEQGRQAAQIKADTEPASKEEIDAVNRSLPPDKRVPYGTTRKALREQGRVGGERLEPKITDDLINTTTAIQQFEELNNAVTKLPTGPLTQYVEQFKERWGIDISDEKVAQRAILAGAQSQLLNARSGTAVSPSEYTRLMNELPNESNDPKVFKARLANTLRQFKNIYKTRVQVLRKLGHAIPDDLMEPLAAPEGAPKPTASTAVDKARDIMKPR